MARAALLLSLTLAACSFSDPEFDSDAVLVNRTPVALVALAVDGETATLIDIADTFTLSERETVIEPGETGPLEVEAYDPGDDVVVFVYRVAGDQAQFARLLQVDGRAFERANGVVTVRDL